MNGKEGMNDDGDGDGVGGGGYVDRGRLDFWCPGVLASSLGVCQYCTVWRGETSEVRPRLGSFFFFFWVYSRSK